MIITLKLHIHRAYVHSSKHIENFELGIFFKVRVQLTVERKHFNPEN